VKHQTKDREDFFKGQGLFQKNFAKRCFGQNCDSIISFLQRVVTQTEMFCSRLKRKTTLLFKDLFKMKQWLIILIKCFVCFMNNARD